MSKVEEWRKIARLNGSDHPAGDSLAHIIAKACDRIDELERGYAVLAQALQKQEETSYASWKNLYIPSKEEIRERLERMYALSIRETTEPQTAHERKEKP